MLPPGGVSSLNATTRTHARVRQRKRTCPRSSEETQSSCQFVPLHVRTDALPTIARVAVFHAELSAPFTHEAVRPAPSLTALARQPGTGLATHRCQSQARGRGCEEASAVHAGGFQVIVIQQSAQSDTNRRRWSDTTRPQYSDRLSPSNHASSAGDTANDAARGGAAGRSGRGGKRHRRSGAGLVCLQQFADVTRLCNVERGIPGLQASESDGGELSGAYEH